MNKHAALGLLIAISLVGLLSFAVIYIWLPSPPPPKAGDPPPHLLAIRDVARELQDGRQWCDAEEKWTELADKADEYPDLKAEADANSSFVKQRCAPGVPMIGRNDDPVEITSKNDSTDATPEQLQEFYPPGRVVQSLGLMNVTGRGSNQKWFLVGDANFAYEARGVAETKVLSNNGRRIEFEAHVKQIDQNLLVSKTHVQFAPIDSPLLEILWDRIDRELKQIPAYRVVRVLIDADPQLRRTLTWINERIVKLQSNQEAQYVEAIDAFTNHRFKIEYISDFGVKTIEVLEGDALPQDDLTSFARRSGPLMDYVMGDVLNRKVGDEFSVDAKKVVRMIGLRYDVDVSGELKLRREADAGEFAVMSILGGEVNVQTDVQGVRRTGGLTPQAGTIKYHRGNLLVSEARADWKMDIKWETEDHLLFATKGARDIEAKSYYEAQLAPAE